MDSLSAAGGAAPAPSSGRSAARRDAALVGLITAAAFVMSARFDLSETFVEWTQAHERLQLDELPGALLVLAVCLLWFSLRRYREARREIVCRRSVEASLVAALTENRRLVRQYLQIEESERRALARDLHDELGQYLNVIKVDVVSLRDRLALLDAGLQRTAAETLRNVDHIQSVVVGLIRELRPIGLDELGLAAALEHCVNEWRRRLPQVVLQLRLPERLDEGLDEMRRLAIYRLVQEALTNVARHSRATQVEIRITLESGAPPGASQVVIRVEDNGVGGDPGHARGGGLGLLGMRERVEAMGGSLEVSRLPARGFVLCGVVPLEAPA